MRQIDLFEQDINKFFEEGNVTKAQLFGAFHRANPKSLDEIEQLQLGVVIKRTYNEDELRHIAVNYAIHCLKGYEGSFTDWFNGISKDWRKIANEKR